MKQAATILGRNDRGVAAVEFALIFPLLMTFLLGSFEVVRYIIVNQKIDHVAYTVADVVGQEESITRAQITDIMSAATEIMDPFGFGQDGIVIISSIEQDPTEGPIVRWQVTGGGTLDKDSRLGLEDDVADMPATLTLNDNENVIVAEVFYNYTPAFSEDYFSTRENYKYAVFKPRYGSLTTAPN
ncbi:MAG: pilus assembly protein [Alphaproteobacteria bacterium]|nr:pilus assembly protein [Alphaproteobacteria bacterium]